MSFFKKLGKSFKKGFNKVTNTVGKVAEGAAKVGVKIGGEVLSTVKDVKDIGLGQLKNISNLTSPGNIMLYAGLALAAIIVLPRVLDSAAAKKVAEKV
jgi:hypothetical protein